MFDKDLLISLTKESTYCDIHWIHNTLHGIVWYLYRWDMEFFSFVVFLSCRQFSRRAFQHSHPWNGWDKRWMASLLPAPHRLTMNNHNFMRINLTWSPPYNDNIYNNNLTWCPPWGFSYTWPSFATSSSAPSEPRSFCSHQTKQWIHEEHTKVLVILLTFFWCPTLGMGGHLPSGFLPTNPLLHQSPTLAWKFPSVFIK